MTQDTQATGPVLCTIENRVAVVTLNDPERRNPISDQDIVDELAGVLGALNDNDDVSVMVLTGAGKAFSAGGNVKAMRDREGLFAGSAMNIETNYRRGIQKIPEAMYALDIPTICAVNGAAIGAGCDLAMMCDIRIASTHAKFGETFLNLGIIPGDGGGWFLQRRIGYERAAELTFTGRVIGAEEAQEIGLVFKTCAPEELMPEAMAMARTIASKPPQALRLAKRLLRQAAHSSLTDFLGTSAAYQALAHHTEDHMEALDAMANKREPSFKGC